jgi:8-oxo-dGTP diphosphatase
MNYAYAHPHPAVTVDIVVLRRDGDEQQILLIRRAAEPFANRWAIPGGFVGIDEDLDTAAARELAEETGLSGLDLSQLHAFGRPDRDPRERVISIAFLAFADGPHGEQIAAGSDAADVRWFNVTALPALAFDHAEIIALARQRLMTQQALSGAL